MKAAQTAEIEPARAKGAGAGFGLSAVDLGLLGVIAAWATGYVGYRYGLREIPTGVFNTVRFVLAVPVYWLILLRSQEDWRLHGADKWRALMCGLVGITLYGTFFALATKYSTVANVSLLLALSPVWTSIVGWFTGRERPTWRFAVGSGIAFGGAALVIGTGSGALGFTPETLRGDLIGLVASILWGLYGPIAQPLLQRHSGVKVQAWMSLFGTLAFLVLQGREMLAFDFGTVTLTGWLATLYVAWIVTVFSHIVWYTAIARVGANRVMLTMYIIPPAAMFFGWLLLGESINAWQGLGAVVALSGVWLVRRKS